MYVIVYVIRSNCVRICNKIVFHLGKVGISLGQKVQNYKEQLHFIFSELSKRVTSTSSSLLHMYVCIVGTTSMVYKSFKSLKNAFTF